MQLLLFAVPYKGTLHWKGQKFNFQKKKNIWLRKLMIFRKKN